ncbi:phosphopantothenoylcysteine decarboxylase subunit VHS3-like [Gossypium raimondii]|uniref:phosphopantothenoylcysteine decarboxylase subunit VHS3-like n=1 Tax=Gossypium raimondii TaxID=29730 RepID=UPI00227BE60B|nr:phosphopantothenoylcysteine decarboxylase subunit VHS3-like [Gossypium raimondii]
MTSLNIEKDEDEEKDHTATTKGKDLVPSFPPTSVTVQDIDIDHLIDKLMETDKEGEEMDPKNGKWRYKDEMQSSTKEQDEDEDNARGEDGDEDNVGGKDGDEDNDNDDDDDDDDDDDGDNEDDDDETEPQP